MHLTQELSNALHKPVGVSSYLFWVVHQSNDIGYVPNSRPALLTWDKDTSAASSPFQRIQVPRTLCSNTATDVTCFLPFGSSSFQSSGFPTCSLVLKTRVYKCLQLHQVSCTCPEPLTSQHGMGRDISPPLLEIHTKKYLTFLRL